MQQNMIDQNIIITEPSRNLRALGRNALTGKWKIAIMASAVCTLCLSVPPAILDELFGVNVAELYYNTFTGGYYNYNSMYDSMPDYSSLSSIYLLLVTGSFTLGLTIFFLALFRKHEVGVSDVFLGFERFGKALGLFLFQSLFIALWTMLFIVPGIIAAIRYSQAFYVLVDDPEKSIRECMNESKRMMRGNKAKSFCLSLSFIGWIILSGIPSWILESVAGIIGLPVFAQTIVSIVGSLFMVPVIVYMNSTFAGFYEILAGHLIKETEPAPIEPEAVHFAAEEHHYDDVAAEKKVYGQGTDAAAQQLQAVPYDQTQQPQMQDQPHPAASGAAGYNEVQSGGNSGHKVDVSSIFSENGNQDPQGAPGAPADEDHGGSDIR